MKRLTIFGCAAIALVIVAAFLAAASVSSANSKGGADRVVAEVFVQVVQLPDLFNPVPRQLGIAHVQVHAVDIDSTGPVSLSDQTADEGWVTCEPAGSEACAGLPADQTPIRWADFSDPSTVTISFPVGPTGATGDLMVLRDGGSPANRQTGETSVTGAAETADSLTWGDWRGRPSFEAWVLSGNITVNRK